jgi:hypothetical protein
VSRAGAPEPRQVPGVFDRPQEAEVVRGARESRAALYGRPDRERFDPVAAARVARPFVEDDEDDPAAQPARAQ